MHGDELAGDINSPSPFEAHALEKVNESVEGTLETGDNDDSDSVSMGIQNWPEVQHLNQ